MWGSSLILQVPYVILRPGVPRHMYSSIKDLNLRIPNSDSLVFVILQVSGSEYSCPRIRILKRRIVELWALTSDILPYLRLSRYTLLES